MIHRRIWRSLKVRVRERERERVGRRREGERRRGGVVGGGRAESVFLGEG